MPTLLGKDSESVETTVRRQGILFEGFVARMGEKRLPRTVIFGEMLGDERYSGVQEWDWMKDQEDHEACLKFEGWREAAQKVSRWF